MPLSICWPGTLACTYLIGSSTLLCAIKDRIRSTKSALCPCLGSASIPSIDGFIYSITFTVSIFTGILTATGMVLHEFPEGIITYLLLKRGGFKERTSLLLAFLAAALTTPLGMLVSYPCISKIDKSLLGALLAFSAGALVYVGATHLLPQAETEHRRYRLLALGAAILVAAIIVFSKG